MDLVRAIQGWLINVCLYAWSFPRNFARILCAHIDRKFNEIWRF